MKDKFGHNRGACTTCNNCEEFISHKDTVRCHGCGCKPVGHEKIIDKLIQLDNETVEIENDNNTDQLHHNIDDESIERLSPIQIYDEPITLSPSPILVHESPMHDGYEGLSPLYGTPTQDGLSPMYGSPPTQDGLSPMYGSPPTQTHDRSPPTHTPDGLLPMHGTLTHGAMYGTPIHTHDGLPQMEDGSVCSFPGCYEVVEFDINTGREFSFCSYHNNSSNGQSIHCFNSGSTLYNSDDLIMIIEDIESDTEIDTGVYPVSLSPHQLIPVMTTIRVPKCSIPECTNTCYVDENGKVHDCCGYSHAMEYQRRLAIQTAIGSNVIKGVTHCLIPECNNLTWPFENYCGRTHADIGKQRGLIPPNTSSSNNTVSDSSSVVCILPNCNSLKYTETNGKIHPYCGQTHAKLAKQLGIFPTTSQSEEQCELEGCTRQRYKEGARIHEYCCADHAKKDAPNREANNILTSKDKVQKWLNQFSNPSVVSLDENDHAKPGGVLFKKFKERAMSLPKDQRQTCLAFHGTSSTNITNICQNGYDKSKRSGQAYGAGEYFATTPDISLGYCRGGKKMLLNELLLGQSNVHHTKHGNIVVMKDPAHDLPRFVVTFK